MLREKKYVVPGDPVAWARPGHNGHHFYDRQKQDKLHFGIWIENQHENEPLFKGPLRVSWLFCFSFPQLVRKPEKYEFHTDVPDLDNCIKFVLDAIKGIAITDDRIVCGYGYTEKRYDENPRTEFIITELK